MDWTYTLPLVASPFCFPPDRLPTQQPADIEDVPGAFLLRGVLTEDECAAIVAGTEAIGYVEGEGEGGGGCDLFVPLFSAIPSLGRPRIRSIVGAGDHHCCHSPDGSGLVVAHGPYLNGPHCFAKEGEGLVIARAHVNLLSLPTRALAAGTRKRRSPPTPGRR